MSCSLLAKFAIYGGVLVDVVELAGRPASVLDAVVHGGLDKVG
jgi:hypothetical protein